MQMDKSYRKWVTQNSLNAKGRIFKSLEAREQALSRLKITIKRSQKVSFKENDKQSPFLFHLSSHSNPDTV